MKPAKTLIASLIILCSLTLWGCSREQATSEHEPLVMVTQPSNTLTEQKSYDIIFQIEIQKEEAESCIIFPLLYNEESHVKAERGSAGRPQTDGIR